MPRPWTPLLALALVPDLGGCCPGSCDDCAEPVVAETPKPATPAGIASLNGFVENKGQWPEEVLFFARRGGVEATVLRDALAFRPVPACDEEAAPAPLILHLPGDAGGRLVEGLDPLVTKHHFLVGNRHASDAAGFDRVALRDVLPGVDVVLRSDSGAFEYDLVLEPGASLEDFTVEVEGATALDVRQPDVLVFQTEAGEVEQRIRASWQGEEREAVACRFRLLEPTAKGHHRFGFEAPQWDRELALVLDPSLVYLTYVGGPSPEQLFEAEVDASGSVYLLGYSFGGSPVTQGAFQESLSLVAAWIGKLSVDGSSLEWATYLGGSDADKPADMTVGADGSVIVLGDTWSPDFPVTPGAYQTVKGSPGIMKSDLFVSCLDPTGSSLLWSTFYGGAEYEHGWACALYPDGDLLVAYEPLAAEPASTIGAVDQVFDDGDQALFRLSADGSQRLWQTFFRASTITDILVDEHGAAYFGGDILSQDAPLMTTPGAFKEVITPGDHDGFVTKMDSTGTQLIWSTYLGGEGPGGPLERVTGLDLDPAGSVYAAGWTHSDSFPVTPGAFQAGPTGASDGFVSKLLPQGSGLAWSTYVGAWGFAGTTNLDDVRVDAAGNAVVFGSANEPTFPVTPDAFQPFFIGPLPSSSDTLLCKLDCLGESLLYATWLGGAGTDYFCELAMDDAGDIYTAFQGGPALATTAGAYQPGYGGSGDLAVAKFEFDAVPWKLLKAGLAGSDAPSLTGIGSLAAGSATQLALRGAAPLSPAFAVAGVLELGLPFLGGTLVPFPSVVVPWTTGALGEVDFTFFWPTAPSGTPVFFQVWTLDPSAPQGWSASNGLKAISQ